MLVRGEQLKRVPIATARALAERNPEGFTLTVRNGRVKKMVEIPKPDPVWEECYRTANAPAFSPWPGWHERYI